MFSRVSLAILALGLSGLAVLRADPPDPDVAGSLPEDYLPGLRPMIAAALKESPEMIKDALSIAIADAQKLYNGIGPMLPQVQAQMQYGENWSAVAANAAASTSNKGFYYDLHLTQPIFQWGQLKNQLTVQKIQAAISRRQYASAFEQFVQTLRSQYLGLITAKLEARNAGFLHDLARRSLAEVRSRIKAGTVNGGEIASAELGEAQAALDEERAKASYAFARREFARELGVRRIADEAVPTQVPAPRFSDAAAQTLLARLLRSGARYTPDAQTLLLNIRQEDLSYQIAKVSQLPMLSIRLDVNQQNWTNATTASVSQTAITSENYYLQAQWDIFDGFETRGRKEEALDRRRQLERQLRITADTLMDQAQNQERTVKFAWDQLAISERQYQLAQESLRTAEGDLARGVGSDDAVDSSRAASNAYELGLMNSRSRFLSSWCDFLSQVGADPIMNQLPARYVRLVK
ncbi:MAG: TolC family protein [Opitutaceae bacterium]